VQRLNQPIQIAVLLVATTTAAHADHHGMAMETGSDTASSYTASVALVAASFSPSQTADMAYGGDYEGVAAGADWAMDRYAAGVSWAYYRLLRNGAEQYGIGDLVVHGQVAVVARHDVSAGAVVALSAPTGNEVHGFGMGHPMAMPALYAAWHDGRVELAASFGYSRALASGNHVHGMAPLVDPMNMSELSWSAGGTIAVAAGVRVGLGASGGVPVGSLPGVDRVIGAARVAWGSARVETAAEVQGGFDGDPFNIRGVVSTALRF
jgi:hypothetical protein